MFRAAAVSLLGRILFFPWFSPWMVLVVHELRTFCAVRSPSYIFHALVHASNRASPYLAGENFAERSFLLAASPCGFARLGLSTAVFS